MLVELSVVEHRYQVVLAMIRDGVGVSEVASRLSVSRRAVHRWLRRYDDQGLARLADRSTETPGAAKAAPWAASRRGFSAGGNPSRLLHRPSRR